jgi:anti-anti-sigma regulatory factor
MEMERKIRGPYACVAPIGDFSAAQVVSLKAALAEDIKDPTNDLAVDLSRTTSLDQSALKFFANLDKSLQNSKRRLAFFGGNDDLQKQLKDYKAFRIFTNLNDFERSFHEVSAERQRFYYQLCGNSGAPIQSLPLICPLCRSGKPRGFLMDESRYEQCWERNITPQWHLGDDEDNDMDFEIYQVAVCPKCYFATTRIDWFSIENERVNVDTVLNDDQVDRLSSHAIARKNAMAEFLPIDNHFFLMPRSEMAGYLSWKLNEVTLKNVSRNRAQLDSYEIAFSNLMMAKYAPDEMRKSNHVSAAEAWLHNVMDHKDRFSTSRVTKSFVFLVSLNKYLGKNKEVSRYVAEFEEWLGDRTDLDFWAEHLREITAEPH